jgi:hypothetical protein
VLVQQAGCILQQFLAAGGFWEQPEEAGATLQQQLCDTVAACVLPAHTVHAALVVLQAKHPGVVRTLGEAAAVAETELKHAASVLAALLVKEKKQKKLSTTSELAVG